MQEKCYALYFGWGSSLRLEFISSKKIKLTEKNNNCVILFGKKNFLEDFLSRRKKSLNNLEIVEDRISPWF